MTKREKTMFLSLEAFLRECQEDHNGLNRVLQERVEIVFPGVALSGRENLLDTLKLLKRLALAFDEEENNALASKYGRQVGLEFAEDAGFITQLKTQFKALSENYLGLKIEKNEVGEQKFLLNARLKDEITSDEEIFAFESDWAFSYAKLQRQALLVDVNARLKSWASLPSAKREQKFSELREQEMSSNERVVIALNLFIKEVLKNSLSHTKDAQEVKGKGGKVALVLGGLSSVQVKFPKMGKNEPFA